MTRHIVPGATRPARLDALASLPVFLDLAGRRVVIAGGGEPVAWKAELAAAAGGSVTVFAPIASPELMALAAAHPSIALHARSWRPKRISTAPRSRSPMRTMRRRRAFPPRPAGAAPS